MNDEKTVPFNESLRNRCTCSSDIPPKLILGRWTMVEDASHNLTGSPEKEEIVHTSAPMKLSRGGDRDRAGLVEKKKETRREKKEKKIKKRKKEEEERRKVRNEDVYRRLLPSEILDLRSSRADDTSGRAGKEGAR